ncbi:restriction endonuclease subunit S [Aeromonas caviae]|uniref:restriction endonuclease subunit S n=1 Tax=Aeromonas caviae TaxID=648 RepID=UPI00191FB09F|nr:restriction endonuclease subunit S [Aeromonas caviae]MBL0499320.1 restriction endonuclease subunit S [Aeromonas caviae]
MAIESLITEHLDIWAAAVRPKSSAGRGSNSKLELTGIKKLRELILELAVRGKLVAQDPNDEPTFMLLERIAAEKALLVKEGKLKKLKAIPEVTDEDKLFELPHGWLFTRLGNIGNIFNGDSINSQEKEAKYTGLVDGLPFIATKDVGYGFDGIDYQNGVLIPFEESKFKIATKDTVLICAEGGSAGKKCGIVNQNVCFGNKLFAVELYGDIDPRFILSVYLTPTFFAQFSQSMTGIIGGISSAKFSELLIPTPPIGEQLRIVAKVNELMALCDQLEQQSEAQLEAHQTLVEVLLATLNDSSDSEELAKNWVRLVDHFDTLFTTEASIDALKQTILQLAVMGKLVQQDPADEPAFALLERIAAEKAQLVKEKRIKKEKPLAAITEGEKPFELPAGWVWCRIISCMDSLRDISYGIIKLEAEPDVDGVPTLRCSDVKPGYIDLTNVRYVSTEVEAPYARTRLKGGEILVNIRGTLGGVSLVPEELAGFNIAREVAMLPLHSKISGEYLVNVIGSPFFWGMIESNLKGIAYKGLNLNTLRDFAIPLPPLEEQHRIVGKVDELVALCDQLKSRLQANQQTQLVLAETLAEAALEGSI